MKFFKLVAVTEITREDRDWKSSIANTLTVELRYRQFQGRGKLQAKSARHVGYAEWISEQVIGNHEVWTPNTSLVNLKVIPSSVCSQRNRQTWESRGTTMAAANIDILKRRYVAGLSSIC